jgi:regulator of protease activity HflC (stomatin/prohibitin superfamily)
MAALILFVLAVLVVAFVLNAAAKVVPQQEAWIVERLGRYDSTLKAGLHLLMPFVDSVRYRHTLMEQVIEIQEQDCITGDNVVIKVDAVLYYQIVDPVKASYGISNPELGIVQLAQTTVRSEIGKIDLDRTFAERPSINAHIVGEIDQASEAWGVKVLRYAWGVKVLRYEIKNIKPPDDIRASMERQMRAERDKRAAVLDSEGKRDALINTAEGRKQEEIKASEAQRQREINEAEGRAAAIRAVAIATADGIREVAKAINEPGGFEAVQLRVAEQYLAEFGKIAKEGNTLVLPANLSDVGSMVSLAMNVIRGNGVAAAIPVDTALRTSSTARRS